MAAIKGRNRAHLESKRGKFPQISSKQLDYADTLTADLLNDAGTVIDGRVSTDE
jgi:hypothetical protein